MTENDLTTKACDYKVIQLIGRGSDGAASIHLAQHIPTKNYVAIKIFHLEQLTENTDIAQVQHELMMGRLLQHDHVAGSMCTFTTEHQIWSALPVHGYGSCKDLLCAHFSMGLPEAAIAYILYDVLKALEYLHQRGVIHRSVKASHIVINSEGHVSLAGLRHCYNLLRNGVLNSRAYDFPSHYNKALLWAAPELLQQNLAGYTTSSDVYSVGITACELANGMVPFSDVEVTQMLLDKVNGVTPRLLDSTTLRDSQESDDPIREDDPMYAFTTREFSPHFHDFIECCLQFEPHIRPTCTKLLQHSFFKHLRKRTSHTAASTTLPELLQPVQPVLAILRQLGQESRESGDVSQLSGDIQNVAITEPWDF